MVLTVHQVKDLRTGKVTARKTIVTLEALMKQLLRELSIISSTEHVNIIRFHGAYMSLSSSEVKIFAKAGVWRKLATVSSTMEPVLRKILLDDWRKGCVSERCFSSLFSLATGHARPRISALEEDYPPRYRTV